MTKSDILLEAGTNELEMLLFELPGAIYGVNVAKVREVILPQQPTPIPESNAMVEGVLDLRGNIVPIISLRKYFGLGECKNENEQRIIVMEFSDVCVGFFVDVVDKIYRMSWSDLSPPPEEAIMRGAAFTAIAKIEEKIVLVVDFERIVLEVSGAAFGDDPQNAASYEENSEYEVLIADDSHTIRKLIQRHLENAGFKVTAVADGQYAWEKIEERAGQARLAGAGRRQFDLLVSDIEMPRMDGLFLTRKLRESSMAPDLPIILFSSLITPDNLKKGKAVGADLQISKPCVHQISMYAGQVLRDRARGVTAGGEPTAAAPAIEAATALSV